MTELQNKIPASLRELEEWYTKEMEDQSYYLQHLELPRQIDDIENEIKEMLAKMAELQIESVQQQTNEINDRIDSFYDALENEVNARHYVDENYMHVAENLLTDMTNLTRETSEKPHLYNKVTDLTKRKHKFPQQH